jgi:anti-anti-sigma regulatory factor
MDLATVALLDRAVADCLALRPNALNIDASALTFCEVRGVHALLRAQHSSRLARAAFQLLRPRTQLIRVIIATHATELLVAHPLGGGVVEQ